MDVVSNRPGRMLGRERAGASLALRHIEPATMVGHEALLGESTVDEQTLEDRLADARIDTDPLDRQAALANVQRGLFAEAEDPVRIGRFVVIERLGTGASGVVYAAYDPQLDRKIALKLLRGDTELPAEAHARLQREAQSLARLSHPHVVAVHDVGDVDGRIFIAMELLQGGTLRRWVEAEPRSPEQVLALYLQAGEGLAAAHAAGLVHRDFKPDNVLLDRRGQVRVVDFGLAREHGHAGKSMVHAVLSGEITRMEIDPHLTETGAVMGTPAYMAPEQYAGRPADARTDQYSFCVALHEALHGERPFADETVRPPARATPSDDVRTGRSGRAVPARVRRALLRGLRADPAERYPDMPALLSALRHDPGAHWRRRGLAAVGLSALVGITWVAAEQRSTPAVACSGFERRLEGVWDEPRRTALAQTLTTAEHLHGADAWARVEPRLTDYASVWVGARRDACEATEVRQEQSDELLDRRVLCLDRALGPLAAAVERLAEADAETIARAVELVPERALVDECSALGVLDDGDPPPIDPQLRARIATLEARIAQSDSLQLAGKYPEALELAKTTARHSEALRHAPTHARALFALGTALSYSRKLDEAIDVLNRAVAEAERGRADRTRARAARWLVRRLSDTSRFEEARRMATVAQSMVGRLAHPPPGAAASVEMLWGHVEWTQGYYDVAIAHFDRAIALTEDDDDPFVHTIYVEAFTNRGIIALDARQPADTKVYLEQALALRTEQDGPEHPELAIVLNILGSAEHRLGNHAQAERWLRRSLEIRERRLGPEHESLAPTIANLGAVLVAQGRDEQGLALQERSLALMERSLGPKSAELAIPLHNIALIYLHASKAKKARASAHRAYEIRRAALGPHHARTFDSLYQLAYIDASTGRNAEARQGYERLVMLLREHRPEDPVALVEGLVGVADMALHNDEPAVAEHAMEEALTLLGDGPQHEGLWMAIEFNLAQALERRHREPQRAQRLAHTAMERARALPHAVDQQETIAAWLEDHSQG